MPRKFRLRQNLCNETEFGKETDRDWERDRQTKLGKRPADEIGKETCRRDWEKVKDEIGKDTDRDWERDRKTRLGKRQTDKIGKETYRDWER